MGYLASRAAFLYKAFYSTATERKIRTLLLGMAGAGFVVEVTLYSIALFFPHLFSDARFLPKTFLDTINAPLTVVLVYEVYLLVTATARSIIEFVSKQFEVVSLILLRGIFKDLSHLSSLSEIRLTTPLLHTIGISLVGSLLLYFLIEVFERAQTRYATEELSREPKGLVRAKKVLALILGFIFFAITMFQVALWVAGTGSGFETVYFREIFSVLVLFDIWLLLLSLRYFRSYELLYEYSAFILASVLVLLALPLEVTVKFTMILFAVVFCIVTLRLHRYVRGNHSSVE